ncbi:protein-tyrosine-phosphatase [Candidatus Nitrososphaera evergladensis SR1]|jgi:arsenate reductase|uniref:Protein-tyrosine-phosphatase n=1 Tax=Candidatus Nitrososphaera evergladensis SR1 TaxID=1459636 RepID=A0A075ML32_9ARCH|nr:arsenate reductase ArsC [Candidatus Nitrososphaera evergladensis]AIF82141.1 protein-tyrosine-phosphatase [Candidatus Nitrososphaera evergladensis SR1]
MNDQQQRQQEKTVLFVCVENAGRSQMAEGFFRKYAPKGYRAISAGTRPAQEINPLAVQAMKEAGVDISRQRSKVIDDDMVRGCAVAVNMGCMDKSECPLLFLNNPVDWGIEDPKGKPIEKVRLIRDDIERRVKELVRDLENSG